MPVSWSWTLACQASVDTTAQCTVTAPLSAGALSQGRASCHPVHGSVALAGVKDVRHRQLPRRQTLKSPLPYQPSYIARDATVARRSSYSFVATVLKAVLRCCPTVLNALTAARAISAAMRPYSIAVAPVLSRNSLTLTEINVRFSRPKPPLWASWLGRVKER